VQSDQFGPVSTCKRHFTVTAGQEEGEGVLFACMTRTGGRTYSYDVMGMKNLRICKTIKINVTNGDNDVSNQILSLEEELMTYDLRSDVGKADFHEALKDLEIGDIFKVQVLANKSARFFFKLEAHDGNGYEIFNIEEPTYIPPKEDEHYGGMGHPGGANEYTLTVLGAGEGYFQLVPYSYR